jgi:hypothetical protein
MRLLFGLVLFTATWSATASAKGKTFQVVHDWPKLPEGFVFGQVSGIDVDSHNHVWVFNRGA